MARWMIALTWLLYGGLALASGTGVSPELLRDANSVAAPQVPYIYDATRRVQALGDGPWTYSRCEGSPSGFGVDPFSGYVQWLPEATGSFAACVQATNLAGESTEYVFNVEVRNQGPAEIALLANASPTSGPAPLSITLDASGTHSSIVTTSLDQLFFAWAFGDGTPPETLSKTAHVYSLPGGYRATAQVVDSFGALEETEVPIRVSDAGGHQPPLCEILSSETEGDQKLAVHFSAEVEEGDAAPVGLSWDFGQGQLSNEATPTVSYGPGRYHVKLVVLDKNGLTARCEKEIVVRSGELLPPLCRAYAESARVSVGTAMTWSALSSAQNAATRVSNLQWVLDDGTKASTAQVAKTYADPGTHRATLLVTDSSGLTCRDSAATLVTSTSGSSTLQILPFAESGVCGTQETGRFLATGANPKTWRVLKAPQGFLMDASTGVFTWTPSVADKGDQEVVLRVDSSQGFDQQRFTLNVFCEDVSLRTGCALALEPTPLWLLALVGAFVLRKSKRPRLTPERRGHSGPAS